MVTKCVYSTTSPIKIIFCIYTMCPNFVIYKFITDTALLTAKYRYLSNVFKLTASGYRCSLQTHENTLVVFFTEKDHQMVFYWSFSLRRTLNSIVGTKTVFCGLRRTFLQLVAWHSYCRFMQTIFHMYLFAFSL